MTNCPECATLLLEKGADKNTTTGAYGNLVGVYASFGLPQEEYTANTIGPIRLLDEMIRINRGDVQTFFNCLPSTNSKNETVISTGPSDCTSTCWESCEN